MFEFDTLITILVTIILSYITLYYTFRHQIDEIESNNKDDNKSKLNIERRIMFINFFFSILIILILFLYFLPNIALINTQTNFAFITKIFPFEKGFFDNKNFKFSYITGIILSIIIIILFLMFPIYLLANKFENIIIKSVITIFSTISIAYGLIWANYYISTYLNYCIIHEFEFISILLNTLAYWMIFYALSHIFNFLYTHL